MLKKVTKKGVSPLIATVLLIAFAVALGAVVMNWGSTFTKQTADNVQKKSDVDFKCSLDVKLKPLEISGRPQICFGEYGSSSQINMTLLNDGAKKIDSVQLTIIGAAGIASNTSVPNSTLVVAGGAKLSASYLFSQTGTLQKIRLVPVVDVGGIATPCMGSGSVLERDASEIYACNASS